MVLCKASRGRRPRTRVAPSDDLLPNYDFRCGVHGEYAARYRKGTNVVVRAADVAGFHQQAVRNEARTLEPTAASIDEPATERPQRHAVEVMDAQGHVGESRGGSVGTT